MPGLDAEHRPFVGFVAMFAKLIHNRVSPIGCSIDDRMISLAQWNAQGPGTPTLNVAARVMPTRSRDVDTAWEGVITDTLRSLVSTGGFINQRCVICPAVKDVQHRHLRMAPMPDTELPDAVRWRMKTALGWNENEYQCDFYDIGDRADDTHVHRDVVVVAASVNALNQRLDILCNAGLETIAIDTRSGAIARCIGGASGQRSCCILDIAANQSTITIVKARTPRFVREIDIGWQQIVDRLEPQPNTDLAGVDQFTLRDKVMHGLGAVQPASEDQVLDRDELELIRPAVQTFGADCIRELSLCSHYLSELDGGNLEPAVVYLLGTGAFEEEITRVLSAGTGLQFVQSVELLPKAVKETISETHLTLISDAYIEAIGLASYAFEKALGSVAA